MMRRLVLLAFLFVAGALSVSAQATGAFNGFCDNGGRFSITSGLTSSNYLEGIIPNCTVTVYLTGTTTLATIFKDAGGTPLGNPFTAATTGPTVAAPGQWLFFAATGVGYDVVMSGGTPPNTFLLPVTLTDLQNGGSGGGGGPLLQTNSVNNLSQSLLNLIDSSSIHIVNTSGGNVQLTASVASGCPGGTTNQIQYNNGSTCAGFTAGQDATIDPTTGNVTLATVNAGPGLCGDATHVCQITTDGKGRVLSQSQIAISGSGGSGALERWITTYWNGTNANNGYVYLVTTVLTATTIPSGCTSSQGVALTGATANSLFTISKLAGGPGGTKTTLCSLQFASGGSGGAQTATLITTTGGSLAAGDVVEIDGPATADVTLSDFTVSLYGTVSGGLVSSVSAANSTLTISPTAGAVLASLNVANANTWTATQTLSATLGFDASGATQAKLPVGASATTAANGELKYDTTNKNWHAWVNGADTLLIPLASGFVSGDCGQPTSTGGSWAIADSGSACGSGGGGGGNANNLNGGALGSAPYQSNTNVTTFIAGPTATGQTFFYGWQPSGALIAPQAINLGTYLASPPPIGASVPNAITVTTLNGRQLVANTTVTIGTTTVSANSCNGPFTTTMTNMAVTSVPYWSAATDITGVSGWGSTGGLMIVSWPTANTLNYKVCNPTATNITPSSSATFNVGAQ